MPDLTRLEKDIEDIRAMRNIKLEIDYKMGPDPKDPTKQKRMLDIRNFVVAVKVNEGLYRDKWIRFKFFIPDDWPYSAPVVLIIDKVWHPNIELVIDGNPKTGRVCVSTLKNNYRGTMLLSEIVDSLRFLLYYPNDKDALNVDAADEQSKNYESFKEKVNLYMIAIHNYEDEEEDDEDL